jgi:hypothetical protein
LHAPLLDGQGQAARRIRPAIFCLFLPQTIRIIGGINLLLPLCHDLALQRKRILAWLYDIIEKFEDVTG